MEVCCSLCNDFVKSTEFNLRTITSKLTNTPLILLIEKVVGASFSYHFDKICLKCYDLINELDAIELRQVEIHRQLRGYIDIVKLKTTCSSKGDIVEHNLTCINGGISSNKSDINLFTCNDTKNNGASHTSDLQCNTETSDLESFDANLAKCESENTYTEIIPKPNVKKRGRRKKYPDVAKPYKCHCAKEFRTVWELKNHMNSHSDHRPFICDICGLAYKYKPAFTRHMDMHNGISPFTCVYCNKSFTQKGALVRHVPLHTGEKPYQCDECGKRFIHHTSFNIHRLSHTGEKSYKCNVCGLALMSGSHLKRHMRIHTGEKKFACETCGRRFAERYNLATHQKLHANPKSTLSTNSYRSAEINRNKNCDSLVLKTE